jgi:hypothetical protein
MVSNGPQQGSTLLGIYEVKGATLRVCFDGEGDQRPREFEADAKSSYFTAVCTRVTPPGEELDITGVYQSEFYCAPGQKMAMKATVSRWGDAYLVEWSKDGSTLWYGIGIRKGNALSVSYITTGNMGVLVYEIKPGPKLIGMFTEMIGTGLIGKEELSFIEKENGRWD